MIKHLRSPYLGVILAPFIMAYIFYSGSLYDSPTTVYGPAPSIEQVKNSKIRFSEVSENLGLNFKHQMWFPNPKISISVLPMLSIYPSSNIIDIDQDGYMDIVLTTPHPENYPRIFRNVEGKYFVDVSKQYGFDQMNQVAGTSRMVFDDLDLDGNIDIVVAKYGCHEIYWGYGPNKKFIKDNSTPLNNYCSNAVSITLVDVNHDGLQDIVFVNYWLDIDLKNYIPLTPNLASNRVNQPGGKSILFLNKGERKFEKTQFLEALPPNYSNNAGIADINNDGYLDIYVANDYSYDRLLINHEGKYLSDETEKLMPFKYHGLNGMNADFADFDRSGRLSLYVGNITNPPFISYNNVLWELNEDKIYTDTARERGVAFCGWTWSGKWSDFDNDGQLDLVVSNGRARGVESHLGDSKSLWHTRSLSAAIPRFLRAIDPTIDYLMTTKHHISSYEKNCLFRQVDGRFYNVADSAGLTDLEDGFGLSLIDFNNDGKIDFLISNLNSAPTFYENLTENPAGHWIGFNLIDKNHRRMPLGAKLKLIIKNAPPITLNYYPTNGFNSQSDPRVIFGLGSDTHIEKLEIIWPGKKTAEIYTKLSINQYQNITEGYAE